MQQIEDKGYARPYGADPRKLYKIGANFSSETGTIEDWKVAENFVSSRANLKEDERRSKLLSAILRITSVRLMT